MPQKKAEISSLVIEVTRRCNMKCPHCLRGPAQALDITQDILDRLLAPVSSIGTITLSGGEPSLRPELLMMVLNTCKHYRISIEECYIVTNGKHITDKFLNAVMAWQQYTVTPTVNPHIAVDWHTAYKLLTEMRDEENRCNGCYVALSMDAYHEPISLANLAKLCSVPHLTYDKYVSDHYGEAWVIAEGRALTNGIGNKTLKELRPWLFEPSGSVLEIEAFGDDDETDLYNIEEIMCNCRGDILKTCDASYKSQQTLKHFNLSDLAPTETWLDRSVARWKYFEETGYRVGKNVPIIH